MFSPEAVNFITLVNACIQFAMSAIGWILSFLLLRYHYSYHKILAYSPTMLLYFIFVFISCFQTFWHALYQIVFWRAPTPLYDPVYSYIAGAVSSQMQATVPLIEFFVCLDRIFTVLYPGKYVHYRRYFPVIAALSIAFALQFAYNYAFDFVGGIPFESNRNKTGITLIYQRSGAMIYSTIKKASISICSFTATIGFYFIISRIHFSSLKARKVNRAIMAMLTVSIFADFLPNVSYGIGMIAIGKAITDVIGPFSISFTSINIGISSILYWNTFYKVFRHEAMSHSIQKSHTPVRVT